MRRQSLHQDWGTVRAVESNEDPNRVSRQTRVNQPGGPATPSMPDVVVKPSMQETALALRQAMRLQQWTKNGLVLAALVFDRKFTDFSTVMVSILAAICFCAASS